MKFSFCCSTFKVTDLFCTFKGPYHQVDLILHCGQGKIFFKSGAFHYSCASTLNNFLGTTFFLFKIKKISYSSVLLLVGFAFFYILAPCNMQNAAPLTVAVVWIQVIVFGSRNWVVCGQLLCKDFFSEFDEISLLIKSVSFHSQILPTWDFL